MVIELGYQPRTPRHAAIHAGMDQHRFGAIVTHRRFGKTVLALNQLIVRCLENPRTEPEPRYAFIQPFLGQVKTTAWQYLLRFTQDIPGAVPRVSELQVTMPTGGFVRLFGADNPQSFRGGYFDGVVLDEYAKMAPYLYSEIIRPTLTDYQGWCYFLDTPKGKNDFHARCQQAQQNPDWFFAMHKASETGLISDTELALAAKDMTSDEYQQEFECSFEAAIKGAIYARELEKAREQQRITSVPYDASLPVETDWDLGIGDAMAIWFSQRLKGSNQVRFIDYYEASGEGFPHYARVLQQRGYVYRQHWAPHDIAVRELGSGKSRLEVAANLGIKFEITPRIHGAQGIEVEEGIAASRLFLGRCWFDAEKCQRGLEALTHYRRDYNQSLNEFKATPVHDWASHGADAFRGAAVRNQELNEAATRKYAPQYLPAGAGSWQAL